MNETYTLKTTKYLKKCCKKLKENEITPRELHCLSNKPNIVKMLISLR